MALKMNSGDARFAPRLNRSIPRIQSGRNVPQIVYAVVGFYPVDVVNLTGRHDAVDIQPSESMGEVIAPVHLHSDVAVFLYVSNLFSLASSNESLVCAA